MQGVKKIKQLNHIGIFRYRQTHPNYTEDSNNYCVCDSNHNVLLENVTYEEAEEFIKNNITLDLIKSSSKHYRNISESTDSNLKMKRALVVVDNEVIFEGFIDALNKDFICLKK